MEVTDDCLYDLFHIIYFTCGKDNINEYFPLTREYIATKYSSALQKIKKKANSQRNRPDNSLLLSFLSLFLLFAVFLGLFGLKPTLFLQGHRAFLTMLVFLFVLMATFFLQLHGRLRRNGLNEKSASFIDQLILFISISFYWYAQRTLQFCFNDILVGCRCTHRIVSV